MKPSAIFSPLAWLVMAVVVPVELPSSSARPLVLWKTVSCCVVSFMYIGVVGCDSILLRVDSLDFFFSSYIYIFL